MEKKIENFSQLSLTPELLRAVKEMGFESPMPIQAMVIPHLLQENEDAIGMAQTGTGKTAAFGLPLLQRIQQNEIHDSKKPQAVVIAPTRELCLQIASDMVEFAHYLPEINILPVYGGSNIESQIRNLRKGVQVIVATPGRLLDLIRRGVADLSRVHTVVLDEADEMLDMGFLEDIENILTNIPENHRTLMFSATMPPQIQRIAERFMQQPKEFVAGNKGEGSQNVRHIFYMVKADDKYLALKRVADFNPDIYGIIFCRTRLQTQEIADKLIADGYNADCLHGDLSQAQRDLAMKKFRDRITQLLVATDVAARGLDVDNLTHVINFSLPDDTAVYTHRSGRTGRAGKTGTSVAIIHSREQGRMHQIEKQIGKKFEHEHVPSPDKIIEKQLFTIADKIEYAEVDPAGIQNYMSTVYKKLQWLSAEELLQRIFSLELNRLLKYYRDMPAIDLNVRGEKGNDKGKRGERKEKRSKQNKDRRTAENGYSRIFLNAGKSHGVMPAGLLELINSNLAPGKHKPEVGRIDLLEDYTLFDVRERDAKTVIGTLKHTDLYGHRLYAEEAKDDKDYAKTPKSDKKRKAEKPEKVKKSRKEEELELLASLPPKQLKKLKQKNGQLPASEKKHHGNYDKFIKKGKKQ